jgi:nitrate/nitrite-specific signal transduction histidine kinase
MKGLRFGFWLVTILAVAVPTLSVQAQAPTAAAARKMDIATAVNLAGRQRMLSQRMVKAYLLLGQDIGAAEARTILHESVAQFESQLAALKANQPTPEVRRAMAALDEAWQECQRLLAGPPGKANAVALYDASEALQKAAHSAVLAYEAIAPLPRAHLVAIAGRQRMLSQRMAKFYFFRNWGLYDAPADMELHLSRAHFTAVLTEIEQSPRASGEVKARVAAVRRDWQPYERVLFASKDPRKMRADASRVAELSERVLAGTEALVAQLLTEAQEAPR